MRQSRGKNIDTSLKHSSVESSRLKNIRRSRTGQKSSSRRNKHSSPISNLKESTRTEVTFKDQLVRVHATKRQKSARLGSLLKTHLCNLQNNIR
jgi:hypothetical protein